MERSSFFWIFATGLWASTAYFIGSDTPCVSLLVGGTVICGLLAIRQSIKRL